jgi:cold shock CspA family protein
MYSPDRGYGFVTDEENTVFFAAASFERLRPGGPPPVLGESVEVLEIEPSERTHPRARRVVRKSKPTIIGGVVKRFDAKGGWGFVIGDDGEEYFLHRSDIASTAKPVVGGRAVFYPCKRQGKSRACHVTLTGNVKAQE